MIPAESTVTFTGIDDLNTYLIDVLTILNTAKTDIEALTLVELSAVNDPDVATTQAFQTALYTEMAANVKEPIEISINNLKTAINSILDYYGASPL